MRIEISVNDGLKSYILEFNAQCCRWWMTNQDGEGVEMSEKNIFDMFEREFKENF
jgi:hypothetical protein